MRLAALTGASIKLSGLFLMICRWVLVKMSFDFNLSGLNGSLSANLKVKKATESSNGSNYGCKWKRRIFVLFLVALIGLCCFLLGVSFGGLRSSIENQDLWKDKDSSLVEHFHVSKEQVKALASLFLELDQITSLKCTRESVHQMPANNTIYCSLKVLSSVSHLGQEHGQAAKDLVPFVQCPVQYENISRKIDLSLWQEKSLSFPLQPTYLSISSNQQIHKENNMPKGNCENTASEDCKSVSFCLEKMCWLFVFGMAVGYKVIHLIERLWRNRAQKQVKQRLPAQQEMQLLQQKQPQAQNSSKTAGKWRRMLLLMFLLAGVAFSIWLFWYLNEGNNLGRKETLTNMCEERARMLQDQFNVSINHVHALAILISTFHHGKQPSAIDQKTFEEYTDRTAFERPLTSGVAYALRVVHSERNQIEKQQGWTIRKMESEDQTLVQDCSPENLDPSPIQDEYAPVIFSQKTVSHIVSIDMMSGKEDRENILRARASGKGVLTSPFKLLKSNHLGVVLTFAVYKTQLPPDATPERRINATVGYIGASYDIPSLVEKLLHQLASKKTIVVNVYDTTNISAPIKMYGDDVNDTGLLHISNIDFGDPARRHEMHCRFKQKPPPPWTEITASVGVLVITLLVGHIFHAAINSIAQMEDDYWKMMELKRSAEAADIAKSEFLATVSHEIRTPMNGVLGMLEMLMDTNLDSTQFDYAQTAHNSGKDLISVINEVLDQAKIESGKLELENVPFNLRAVLDNVLSIFSVKLHEKRVELAVYVSNQVPEVVIGDPGRLRQIITNLVGNSIKFTHEGHVFVTVHLASEERHPLDVTDEVLRQSLSLIQDRSKSHCNTLSGSPVADRWKSWANFEKLDDPDLTQETGNIKLLVTVEDTGVGILTGAEGRIFMPFMQADSSTSRKYGGTGIGLSISKRLVELMKGEIGFASERDIGSTFSFTAALTKGEMQCLEIKRQPYTQSISEFHGLKALIVDGKSVRAQVTKYHLWRLGISVDICSSVESACSFLSSPYSMKSKSEHLGVVLVDEEILDNTGLALERLLKVLRPNDYPNNLQIPTKIVLLATCINSSKLNELKSAGFADNILTKPLRLSVLISCFQEATGIGRKRQVNRGQPSALGNLLKDRKILVVDDNIVNRRVAEGALKNCGAIVTCVDSGKAALEKLKPPHKFDACFMDLQMPEMDGFEATRQIRSLEKKFNEKIDSGEVSDDILMNVGHWHTPILAMTADVIQATNEECTKCGMDDYVLKPFEKEQLYSAVAPFFESG